ncbi:MAG: stage 0 sporulation protein [Anaerolineales bacterium]|nr:stage 0 sporulation protein [Anaerolineales bacterium]
MAEKSTSKIVGIRFHTLGKLYHFDASDAPDVKVGDYVVVSTSRGRELGQIIHFVSDAIKPPNGSWKPIERRATPQELVMRRMWQRRELETTIDCREAASDLGLQGVKIAKTEFSFDGSRLTVLYSVEGDEKIDLKELRARMRKAHRSSRVEMRQVGPRDVAKIFSGMGACGLETRCCSKFLSEFSPISIRMAKAQGVSLNPQEITGMCGRLRCCLLYEYEQYAEARKHLPKLKKQVITPFGEGKVVDVLALKQAVIVQLEDGRRVEFLKHEIQPYEEYKALEEKAKNPCDRHQNGDCDCGKKEGDP